MTERVYIFDTTLRDGEQSPGASMNFEEKLLLARQLERLRVDVIEAGFPISSDGDFESVKRIAQEVRPVRIGARARPAFLTVLPSCAIRFTDSKSPSEEIGTPASMT